MNTDQKNRFQMLRESRVAEPSAGFPKGVCFSLSVSIRVIRGKVSFSLNPHIDAIETF
jgi:hypothetical protein